MPKYYRLLPSLVLCHLGHLVDVDDFVGDQFFPLVERGDGHGGILEAGK